MKATLSWQNPFAWQIITFISSCKLYSLFFLTKLGIFLQLVSIPSAAVSRIPASRPSTSWWYSLLAYPMGAACCQLQMAYASRLRTWHWQCEKVTTGYCDWEVTRRAGERGRGSSSFFPMGARWDRRHICIMHQSHPGGVCCWRWSFLLITWDAVRRRALTLKDSGGKETNSLLWPPARLGLHVCDVCCRHC